MVTGGLGAKDLIGQIQEDLGGARKGKRKPRDYSFLKQYTIRFAESQAQKVIGEIDDHLPEDGQAVSSAVRNYLSNVALDVNGVDYAIDIIPEDIEELVAKADDLDQKIKGVMREIDVTRKKAKRVLLDRARRELKAAMDHQKAIIEDDMEILEILLLADEL